MDLDFDRLDKSIANGLEPLYLIFGKEQYLVETSVNKIKKKFGDKVLGINYILIDDSNIDNLISDIEMPAFGYDKKLIIVKSCGLFKKDGRKKSGSPIQDKIAEYIIDNMDMIKESVNLVFVDVEADKNVVYDAISKNGIVCDIEELKPMQLIKKLRQICSLYKVSTDDITLNYLLETSGTNLQVLINEIRKLIEYVGENGTIKIEDVNNLSVKQIESIIFELTDNLAVKKLDKALDVLDNLIYQKEPTQKILVTLYNHFKKLYLCQIATDLRKDVVTSLSLKPNQTFLVTKYKQQASHFKLNDLRKIINELSDLDYNYKIGKIDLDVGLRAILCNYCS